MKIVELSLYTNDIQAQSDFYKNVLGCEILEEQLDSFAVKIGHSILRFKQSDIDYKYHYCFLIPSNHLAQAVEWLKARLTIVTAEPNSETSFFDFWNAEAVYFLDGVGNISEFIVRYDMDNASSTPFALDQIISVNEIGMPTMDIPNLYEQLNNETGVIKYSGNLERFFVAGDEEGLFLLINSGLKKTWFPTNISTQYSPFDIVVEVNEEQYTFRYEEGKSYF